jgi:hypothetical protein
MHTPVPRAVTAVPPDRPWYFRFWSGMLLSAWLRIILRNRLRITPARIPMCLLTILFGCINSLLGCIQHIVYGRRIANAATPDDPVFIIGHWRSGTTLLHELFALDARMTCPDTYACFAPAHFLVSRRWLAPLLTRCIPGRPTDTMRTGWDRPQEDEFALCNLGLPSPYLSMIFPNHPPAFPAYHDLATVPPPARDAWFATLTKFFRAVVLQRPGRLVVKSPLHTFRVRLLLEHFPRARFVYITRNPYEVFASTMALWQRLFRDQALQRPRYAGLEEHVLATFEAMAARLTADRAVVPPGQFCTTRYEDLLRDPAAEMQRIYTTLQLGDAAPVLSAIAMELPRLRAHQPARHALSSAQRDAVTRRWHRQCAHYS